MTSTDSHWTSMIVSEMMAGWPEGGADHAKECQAPRA